jgi:hypothetical protein
MRHAGDDSFLFHSILVACYSKSDNSSATTIIRMAWTVFLLLFWLVGSKNVAVTAAFSSSVDVTSRIGTGAVLGQKKDLRPATAVVSKRERTKQRPSLQLSSTSLWALSARRKDDNDDDDEHLRGPDDNATSTTTSSSRRRLLRSMLLGTVTAAAMMENNNVVQAFDRKAYPVELYAADASSRDPVLDQRDAIIERNRPRMATTDVGGTIVRSIVWAGALWLLSGSRSNPLVTPLANVLYNDSDEAWLKDRNDGLFAGLPLTLLIVWALTFGVLGYGVDALVLSTNDQETDVSLQLAGVALIGGGSLELGRIASGEKLPTRQEADRSGQLENEFATFAERRLIAGGNCHRNEVVRAFRRYYAKYRRAPDENDNNNSNNSLSAVTDLEIEQLLRAYGRQKGVDMSSAGFYVGLQINTDADVFVQR